MKIVFEYRSSIILFNILLGLPNKKPFILPSNICPIVIATFKKAKRPFTFVDISLKTFEMNKEKLIEIIREKPDAYGGILWLRPYGINKSNEDFFLTIKKLNKKIFIIDDCCLSKPSLSFENHNQDLTLFSTGYSKYIDYGWGGFGWVNSKEIHYSRADLIFDNNDLITLNKAFQNSIDNNTKYVYSDNNWLGGEIKHDFTEYRKKIIEDLPKISNHKKRINNIYSNIIYEDAQFPQEYQDWRFNIYINNKDKLIKKIFSEKLFASSHYYPMPKLLKLKPAVNSEILYNKIINLFNDKRYSEKMAVRTAKLINNHISKWGFEKFE